MLYPNQKRQEKKDSATNRKHRLGRSEFNCITDHFKCQQYKYKELIRMDKLKIPAICNYIQKNLFSYKWILIG